jgi:hypothetical protein
MDLGRVAEAAIAFESALAMEPANREFQDNLDAARGAMGPVAESTPESNSSI